MDNQSIDPISAVTGQGVRELLFHIKELLDSCPKKAIVFEQEFFPEDMLINESLPFTVQVDEEDPSVFIVEGPRIEKCLVIPIWILRKASPFSSVS